MTVMKKEVPANLRREPPQPPQPPQSPLQTQQTHQPRSRAANAMHTPAIKPGSQKTMWLLAIAVIGGLLFYLYTRKAPEVKTAAIPDGYAPSLTAADLPASDTSSTPGLHDTSFSFAPGSALQAKIAELSVP